MSRRSTRSDDGDRASARIVRPRNAPAQRASVSRSDVSPDESATFATEPLTPKRVAATSTIA